MFRQKFLIGKCPTVISSTALVQLYSVSGVVSYFIHYDSEFISHLLQRTKTVTLKTLCYRETSIGVWFLEIAFVHEIYVCVSLCVVCVHAHASSLFDAYYRMGMALATKRIMNYCQKRLR